MKRVIIHGYFLRNDKGAWSILYTKWIPACEIFKYPFGICDFFLIIRILIQRNVRDFSYENKKFEIISQQYQTIVRKIIY